MKEKMLCTQYYSQRNNKILPLSVCGTTCLAEYLSWLNHKFNKSYECDDDKVFEILNSTAMIDKAQKLIGVGETYIKEYLTKREDNKTTKIDESKFNFTNQFMIMLCECGSFITNNEVNFSYGYKDKEKIKELIDNDTPSIIAGKFTGAGHYVMIVGYNDTDWIIDDPYGDMKSGYKNANGAKCFYSISEVDKIVYNSSGKYLCMTAKKI